MFTYSIRCCAHSPSFAHYELRRTCRVPCQDSPAPSSPRLSATAAKGFACRLVFWSRSRESKSNSGVFLKLLAFANFAFFAAPKLLHSPTPSVQVPSPSRTADFLPLLCSTSTTNFDSPTLQAFGGFVASQPRR